MTPKEILPLNENNQELISVLQTSLYPGASLQSVEMVISYCRQVKLDPMQKPVHIVPMWDSKLRQMRDVVMPGIGLYRIQAARSGECGGISEPDYGEDITENIGGAEITYPKYCKVTVKRMVSGVLVEFSATEFWKENYATKGGKDKSIAPNAMWSKRPYGQIAKCAEAQALRKAFPEFGAQPTAEEMEGKYIDVSDEPEKAEEAVKESYPEDRFNKNFARWEELIKSGKRSAAQVIKQLKDIYTLTNDQIAEIESIECFDADDSNNEE